MFGSQAAWALGNIAGTNSECRDMVLAQGAMDGLLPLLLSDKHMTMITRMRNMVWTLSNFCRGKPCPEWKYVQPAIKALSVLLTSEDEEILQDSAWACSFLCDVENVQQIQAIKASGSLDRLFGLLSHKSANVRHPALRAIRFVVKRDQNDGQMTQYLLNLGLLHKLRRLMISDTPPIKRESICVLIDLTADSERHIEMVIDGALFPIFINVLKTEKYATTKHAIRAICNALKVGNAFQILKILNMGVLAHVIQWLADVSKSANDEIRDFCEVVLSVEEPMKLLLSGYSRFQCGIADDIPLDVLRITMQFATGSTLDLRQEMEMRGIVESNVQIPKLSE